MGYSETTSKGEQTHAFLYTGVPGAGGKMVDLETMGGTNSYAYGINRKGQIVGASETPGTGYAHGFLYEGVPGAGGKFTDLGSLGGGISQANAISDGDLIVGESLTSRLEIHACEYSFLSSSFVDLHTIGGTYSTALGVNRYYGSVGYSYSSTGDYYAVRCPTHFPPFDLGLGPNSCAYGINDKGMIAGSFETASKQSHAFSLSGHNKQDPGTLGGTSSVAYGINKFGQIAGASQTAEWDLSRLLILSGPIFRDR